MPKEPELKILDYLTASAEGRGFISQIARLRTVFNLLEIVPKIAALQKCADKIILFGS